jgi:hypothetical protein
MRLGGPPEARARILLIEDDDETAAYVENGLGGGHAVERARDGTDGLFLATTEAFDVIVVDRLLPIIDGLTVVKMLRAGLCASDAPAPQHHVPAGTAGHLLLCLLDRRRYSLTYLTTARADGPPRRRRPLRTLRAAAAASGRCAACLCSGKRLSCLGFRSLAGTGPMSACALGSRTV